MMKIMLFQCNVVNWNLYFRKNILINNLSYLQIKTEIFDKNLFVAGDGIVSTYQKYFTRWNNHIAKYDFVIGKFNLCW